MSEKFIVNKSCKCTVLYSIYNCTINNYSSIGFTLFIMGLVLFTCLILQLSYIQLIYNRAKRRELVVNPTFFIIDLSTIIIIIVVTERILSKLAVI